MEKILVFGAGGYYELTKEALQRQYAIVALVDNDQKKIGCTLDGKSIISPEEIHQYNYDYIFVTSMFYDEIEKQLIKLGIQQEKIRHINQILNNNKELFLHDYAYIKHRGNHIIAYIPIELLYTERFDTAKDKMEQTTEELVNLIKTWEDINIIRLKPHRELFYFFRGQNSSLDAYLAWHEEIFKNRNKITKVTPKQVIDKKYNEYILMSNELNQGMEFFINNPIEVVWNERGYFNILDGHHRAMFLYCSGVRKIPAKIKMDDYNKWLNTDVALKCLNTINKQNRVEFYTPLLNPYFINKTSCRDFCYKSRLDYILEFWSSNRFSDYTVLDVGSCLGYFAQFFAKEKAIVTAIEPDQLHYDLSLDLNNLLYTSYDIQQKTIEDLDLNKKFDICIMLTVFYHYFNDLKKRKQIIEIIDKVTKKFLIWESGEIGSAEEEKKYIMTNTKFSSYIKLGTTYGTGKIRELGIFYKSKSDFGF